jgi:hypothetical protein
MKVPFKMTTEGVTSEVRGSDGRYTCWIGAQQVGNGLGYENSHEAKMALLQVLRREAVARLQVIDNTIRREGR